LLKWEIVSQNTAFHDSGLIEVELPADDPKLLPSCAVQSVHPYFYQWKGFLNQKKREKKANKFISEVPSSDGAC
jgi:hypothetical protein